MFVSNTNLTYTWSKIKLFMSNIYQAKEVGKGLSTNDFTTAEKTKLASLNAYTADGTTLTLTANEFSISQDTLNRIIALENAMTWNGTLTP